MPIGADQKQHLELARDLAAAPEPPLRRGHAWSCPRRSITEAPIVPGDDGRKMSKSYGNTIPLFAPQKALRDALMKYKSDSAPLEAPRNPTARSCTSCTSWSRAKPTRARWRRKLRAGGYGWGHAKQALVAELEAHLAPLRERYRELRADEARLDACSTTAPTARARSPSARWNACAPRSASVVDVQVHAECQADAALARCGADFIIRRAVALGGWASRRGSPCTTASENKPKLSDMRDQRWRTTLWCKVIASFMYHS